MHKLREGRSALRFAAKRIRNQLREVFAGERRKRDLLYPRTGVLEDRKLASQRVHGIDLVVPRRAYQHQVLQIRSGQEIFQQVKRRRIKPLQVIKEQRKRVLGPSKDANKPPETHVET